MGDRNSNCTDVHCIWYLLRFVRKVIFHHSESQQQALSSEMENYKKQMTSVNNQSQDSFDQSVKFVESVSYPVTPVIEVLKGI